MRWAKKEDGEGEEYIEDRTDHVNPEITNGCGFPFCKSTDHGKKCRDAGCRAEKHRDVAVVSSPYREKIVSFGEAEGLIGVLTIPTVQRAQASHVVLINSGLIHRIGVSRLHVEFAREFAAAGITTLRFDLAGIGDSERPSEALSLQESVKRDIAGALAFLSTECGAARFVLIGLCSGAYDAFQVALGDPRVSGAVLIDIPGPFQTWRHIAYHLGARVFHLSSWRNPIEKMMLYARVLFLLNRPAPKEDTSDFVQGVRPRTPFELMQAELDSLLARNVELYFIFTAGVPSNYNHRSQFRSRFPRAASHRALSVEFLPESDHMFSARNARTQAAGLVRDWMLRPGGPAG